MYGTYQSPLPDSGIIQTYARTLTPPGTSIHFRVRALQIFQSKGVFRMRKLITSGMFVVGMVSLPVSMSMSQARHTPPSDYRNDPRLQTLRKFFSKADCPEEKYSEAFLEAA